MHIVISSHNPVKIAAVEAAFRKHFAQAFTGPELQFQAVSVPSGVSDQPAVDEETRRGAQNRALAAREKVPQAQFWVGLEGGLEWIDGQPLASAWMWIEHASGRHGCARTPTLPLPPGIGDLLRQGLELGDANDRIFGTRHSKLANGAFGLLTEDRVTRQSVYTETLLLALLPLTHNLWSNK